MHGNLWSLKVPMPRVVLARGQREVPTSLPNLVAAHRADPVNGQVLCQTPTCATFQQVNTWLILCPFSLLLLVPHLPLRQAVPTTLVPAQGRVLLVQLVRTGGGNMTNKVTTAITRTQANDPSWPRKGLVMVVAHSGTGDRNTASHYFSFILRQGVWWRVDTGTGTITQEDPFVSQMGARDRMGFTINLLVFKE